MPKTDKANPIEISQYSCTLAEGVAVYENSAFVARDANGVDIVNVTDPTGNLTIYQYRSNNYLKNLIDKKARVLNFTYSNEDLPKVLTIGNSHYNRSDGYIINPYKVYLISYDLENKTVYETRRGKNYSILMNNQFNPIEIINPLGCSQKMIWDSNMHLLQNEDANLNNWSYSYDAGGNLISKMSPLGQSTYYSWENMDNDSIYISLLNNITDYSGNVKIFEFGNEVYHGNHIDIKQGHPDLYAERYLKVRSILKKIDSKILLGAVLHNRSWNRTVGTIIKDSMDFGIIHYYPVWYKSNESVLTARSLFNIAFAAPEQFKVELEILSEKLKQYTGKNIPLAITEYNGGFVQQKPVPYRHTLGNALLNADILRVLLNSKIDVLFANYWQFANGYWGLAYNPKFMKGEGNYVKRPNYFVFYIFAQHFGSRILDSAVFSLKYSSPGFKNIRPTGNQFPPTPYLSVVASTNYKEDKLYLMTINKNITEAMPSRIEITKFPISPLIKYWTLDGPSISATNENGREIVKISKGQLTLKKTSNQFNYVFPPHSLTALEIDRAK